MNPVLGTSAQPPRTADGVVVIDVRAPVEQLSIPPGDPIPGVRHIAPKARRLDENDHRAAGRLLRALRQDRRWLRPWLDYLHTLR